MQSYRAHCKINLNLRVLGKREDGFHEVDTLMAPLSLHDGLAFERADETTLICDQADLPVDDSNLVIRALKIFEKKVGRSVAYKITLVKRIPHGAGLGGGSSDAATTLLALNELEQAGLSQDEMVEMSAELGSDVGFFIRGGICRCSGRGEIVTPVPELKDFKANVLLLKPSFSVSTPDAYKRWANSRFLKDVSYEPMRYEGVEMVNDLERPVFEKFLFLARVKQWLLEQKGVLAAMMSGSGSTMFALVDSPETSKALGVKAQQELDPTLQAWSETCFGSIDQVNGFED